MQVLPTKDSEFLLLRSPKASEASGGAIGEAEALKRGNTVGVRDQVMDLVAGQGLKVSRVVDNLLPTPAVAHIRNHDEPIEDYLGRRLDYLEGRTKGMPGASLGVAVRMQLFPTPLVDDAKNSGHNKNRRSGLVSEVYDLANAPLLPTPKALDGVKGNLKTSQERLDAGHQVDLPNVAVDLAEDKSISWGKFDLAIKRWEEIIGRDAPAPTKPDGRDDAHRLSADFVEWMMGLPEGWVCHEDIGLKRNEQLKALGNGVVPQQAEMALRLLIDDEVLEKLGK
jgi:hypothetical protein